MRRGRLGVVVGGLVLVALIAACSPRHDDQVPSLAGWHTVALRDGIVPATLVTNSDALFIGGERTAGATTSPALTYSPLKGNDLAPAPIRLEPRTPYGQVAELTSITLHNRTIIALGAARGGAHANVRWTTWTGTSSKVVDRPQTFETFGGEDAGTLLGVTVDAHGPLVVGTWQGAHGLDGAVWRADGDRWVRRPSPPALQNAATRQVSPRFLDRQEDGSVTVSGSVLDLTDGVRQSAATWRDVNGSWSLAALPDAGQRSEAWSTACRQTCWSAGFRDDQLAVWSTDGLAALPDLPATDTDAAKVLLSADRVIVTASLGDAGRLLVGHDGTWDVYASPEGVVQSAALVGSRLYLVAGKDQSRTLWVRDLNDVLTP